MRPFVPAVGAATVALTGEAAGVALGVPDPGPFLLGLAGVSASLGALVVAQANTAAARRRAAGRRARLRRLVGDARRTLRLLEHCTDAEIARLREVRRQVRRGERSEF